MVANEAENIPVGYPINFTSPLPLEECANRIRQSFDQRMGMSFAHIQGRLEKIDDTTYTFSIYQDLKHWREKVSGRFIAQTASSTLVEASFTRGDGPMKLDPEKEKFLLPIIIIAILACVLTTPMPWGLIIAVLTVLIIALILYTNEKRKSAPPRKPQEPASELLWYFQRTFKN